MLDSNDESDRIRLVRASRLGASVPGPVPATSLPTPDGFYMLFTPDWHPIEPANRFMMEYRYKPSKTSSWQNTQRASAQDLAQWWTYLSVNDIPWDEATPDDLADYASSMAESVSVNTSRQFATSTVDRRTSGVETFYSWAKTDGLAEKALSLQQVITQSAQFPVGPDASRLPHLGTPTVRRSRAKRPRGRDPEDNPRPFKAGELPKVLDRLGPPIFKLDQSLCPWEIGTKPRRNRLMAEAAYHTGMRGDEVASISAWEVLDRARFLRPDQKWQQFKLTVRTKGKPSRQVIVSSVVLRALVRYHDVERAGAVRRAEWAAKDRGVKFRVPTELFVNGASSNLRDAGRPVSAETASRAFTGAVIAEGLTIDQLGYDLDPITGELVLDESGIALSVRLIQPAHTFHDLRHTFAVLFYWSEVSRGNPEPWQKLQARLGHSSSTTTKDVYLKHVDVDEASISDLAAHRVRVGLHAVR